MVEMVRAFGKYFGDSVPTGLLKSDETTIRKGYARELALILVHLEQTSEPQKVRIILLDQQISSVLWVLAWSCAIWNLFSENSSFKIY